MNVDTMLRRGVLFNEQLRGKALNYERVFNKRTKKGMAAANLRTKENSETWGVLYTLTTPAGFVKLDGFEPGYRRIRITVNCPILTKNVEAITFQAVAPEEGFFPSSEYLQTMIDGARQHGLIRLAVDLEALRKQLYKNDIAK
jgi:hypothetical protein